MGQPYIKFFGADWISEKGLRLSSPAARGVWIDCVALMTDAEPHGHLVDTDGSALSVEDFCALTNTPAKVAKSCFDELERRNVFSRTGGGVIFSRRMVKDAIKLAEARKNGKRGGNPAIMEGRDNGPDKPIDKTLGDGVDNRWVNPPVKPRVVVHSPEAIVQKEDDDDRAGAPDPNEVGERVLALMRIDPARWLGDYGRVRSWLAQGFDPEMDIYPAVQRVMAKRPVPDPDPISKLKYFDREIVRQRADRTAPMPEGIAVNGHRDAEAGPDRAANLLLDLQRRAAAEAGHGVDGGAGGDAGALFPAVPGRG